MKRFEISTVDELARLLLVHPRELADVTFNRGKLYRSQKLRKPNGGFRVLHVPQGPLKLLQQKINRHILDRVEPLKCVHGGVRGRSVVTNARPHVGKAIVFCVDIKDFFPSVRTEAVCSIFESLGFSGEAAKLLTQATTWDSQLPQGAPTSPALANLSLTKVDVRFEGLAASQGFDYTRFVDDLAFSGPNRLKKFRGLIQKIVAEAGFQVNPDKVFTMHSGMRQVVTKIVVNRKINLTREKRKQIRDLVLQSSSGCGSTGMHELRGQLSWLSSVNPTLGNKFRSMTEIN